MFVRRKIVQTMASITLKIFVISLSLESCKNLFHKIPSWTLGDENDVLTNLGSVLTNYLLNVKHRSAKSVAPVWRKKSRVYSRKMVYFVFNLSQSQVLNQILSDTLCWNSYFRYLSGISFLDVSLRPIQSFIMRLFVWLVVDRYSIIS